MDQNQQAATEELVTESLVEEVSIDGMCGVY
ncbi:mycofactocin precursor MftA [Mycobacterium sp. smrl_JER01]